MCARFCTCKHAYVCKRTCIHTRTRAVNVHVAGGIDRSHGEHRQMVVGPRRNSLAPAGQDAGNRSARRLGPRARTMAFSPSPKLSAMSQRACVHASRDIGSLYVNRWFCNHVSAAHLPRVKAIVCGGGGTMLDVRCGPVSQFAPCRSKCVHRRLARSSRSLQIEKCSNEARTLKIEPAGEDGTHRCASRPP